jgi:hypothetical protein
VDNTYLGEEPILGDSFYYFEPSIGRFKQSYFELYSNIIVKYENEDKGKF